MEWSDQTNPRSQGRYGVDFTEDHAQTQRGRWFLDSIFGNGDHHNGIH